MKCSILTAFAWAVILLSACSGNKGHITTNTRDSLNTLTATSIVEDGSGSQSLNDSTSERAADSAAISGTAKMFGFSPDSPSFIHMKDSMLSMVKDKMGKNAAMLDSMMSALSKLSTSSSTQSATSNDSDVKRTIPYHEALSSDYVIPVTGNGSGFYYEYVGGSEVNGKKSGLSFTMSADPAKTSGWNVYLDGYAEAPQFGINTHFLFLMNNSFTHLVLNADHKVYTIQKGEEAIQQKNYSITDIKVTKIGNEKLHGFNCVHAKVTAVSHFLGQTQNNEFDIWRSEEVPGAPLLESSIAVFASPFTLSIEDQLVKIACKGAVVKIEFDEKSSVVRKELYAIAKQNIDDSIFNIPSDYKEDKNTSLYSLIPAN